jgi:hypothetical protein
MQKSNKIEKAFKKSLEKKWCLRFNTNHPDKDAYDLVVIHIGKLIVVAREFRDFESGGIIAFPRKSLTSVRDGDFEICENQILRRSGEIKKAKSIKWLNNINTIRDLVCALSKRKLWPAVEQVRSGDFALFVGPIFHIEDKVFEVYCYDAAGNWEGGYGINFKNVFKIEFDSKYLNYFNGYMMANEKPLQPVGF